MPSLHLCPYTKSYWYRKIIIRSRFSRRLCQIFNDAHILFLRQNIEEFFYDSVEIMAEGTLCTNYGEKEPSKKPKSTNELFFYTLSVAPRDEYSTRI